jgi:hypothetical protein
MGVKGLHTYLEGRLPSAKNVVNLPDLAALSGSSTVVVDGMALIRKMYPPDLEWVVGGQFAECWACVADFVRAFAACRLRLVVFFDGGIDDAKIAEWRGRRQKDLSKCERVVEALSRGEHPAKSCWMPPPNISKAVGGAFAEQGCDVYFTAGEADREMAAYCTARRCAAVLAKDSDFFILPVPAYLNLDTLDLRSNPPRVTAYRRADVEAALGLPSALLPLLGSLVGNDFVPKDDLDALHAHILPGRHASGGPLIEATARYVEAAAAAAGWVGPRPSTPLLWCAIDLHGRVSPRCRRLIEASLEQCAEIAPRSRLDRA